MASAHLSGRIRQVCTYQGEYGINFVDIIPLLHCLSVPQSCPDDFQSSLAEPVLSRGYKVSCWITQHSAYCESWTSDSLMLSLTLLPFSHHSNNNILDRDSNAHTIIHKHCYSYQLFCKPQTTQCLL